MEYVPLSYQTLSFRLIVYHKFEKVVACLFNQLDFLKDSTLDLLERFR